MPQHDADGNGHAGGVATETVVEALKSKELLGAAALSAAGAVAASKAPALVKKLTHATENRGEDEVERLGEKAAEGAKSQVGGGLGGKLIGKALGGGGGGGAKKTRRLPVQRWTDVAVPVDKAYEAWTKFDDFPKFMHRVLNVEQKGQDRVSWQEKIWFSTRQWEGRITERRRNERIVWKTTNGMSHKGIVSFHPLGENLTRVMVDMEFEPTGMMEKMASGLRFVKRAVQADLARFKAYVEMEDAKGIEYRASRDGEGGEERGGSDSRAAGNRQESDAKRSERREQRDERRRAAAG